MARVAPPSSAKPDRLCQLRITLEDFEPEIWRRVLVPPDLPLDWLHSVVQAAMGWENDHLYEFYSGAGRRRREGLDEALTVQQVLARTRSKIYYFYDFGDSWDHLIRREPDVPRDPELPAIRCIAGEQAGPPEDSGGTWGYAAKLEALGDPEDPDHDFAVEWLGEGFDPAVFDIEAANRKLTSLAKAWERKRAGRR